MEGSLEELAKYRMERAKEMLRASEDNLEIQQYRTSLNRSYYAVFHAIRAVNALDEFDSSKHSGVIAHFNQFTLKEGKLDPSLNKIIKDTSYLREKSDYDDFFLVSQQDTEMQLENARLFVNVIEEYLNTLIEQSPNVYIETKQIPARTLRISPFIFIAGVLRRVLRGNVGLRKPLCLQAF